MLKNLRKVWKKATWPALVIFLIWYTFFSLPKNLFNKPTSTLLFSKENTLLGGTIAKDGQWRFPSADTVPFKIKQCMLHFEDEYFYYHFGFNPVSLFRATYQNISNQGIKSGGSTITMQTIRLSRDNPKRTITEKIYEIVLATRLEFRYSKEKILSKYLSNAPFGGNVVGIDAAAWRYYKRQSNALSWGEAATLAVLPNAPSLIYPGKNQQRLTEKRNRLLKKLLANKVIDSVTCHLAMEEPLPQKPNVLPETAPHLLQWANKIKAGQKIETTIVNTIQNHVNLVVEKHHWNLKQQEIHNLAAIVIEVKTGNIVAYTGNTSEIANEHANNVDIIQAPRSSGSILKPFLYQKMMDEGKILPTMLLPDIPFKTIKNYYQDYDGAVPAEKALARSLNIPAVYLLQEYGVAKFKNDLEQYGFKHFHESSDYYGLSLIIGGGEVTLFELAQAYTNMAYQLVYAQKTPMQQLKVRFDKNEKNTSNCDRFVSPNATYLTLKALKEVLRPQSEMGWQNFNNTNISWKTGTSHGFRDAWAVGITPKYVVAVWAGNADGEGRPDMTGTKIAAPVLFDIFDLLGSSTVFKEPQHNAQFIKICKQSGFRMGPDCTEHQTIKMPKFALNTAICPYHKTIYLDKTGGFRVNSSCYAVHEMQAKKQFILPPKMAYFYQRKNPFYEPLPPFIAACSETSKAIELIYPRISNYNMVTKILIPTNLNQEKEKVIFEAVHANNQAVMFWHIDDEFIQETKGTHKVEVQPSAGKHKLTITDVLGNEINTTFEIVN